MNKALSDYLYAVQITFKRLSQGHYWLYILPSVVVFLIYYGIKFQTADEETVAWYENIPLFGSWLKSGTELLSAFMSAVFEILFQFTILTLLSPVNCLLSEKVDNDLTGASFSGGVARMISDLFRAILIVFIATLLYFVFAGVWWILTWVLFWVPYIDQISNVMYFLIAAFFVGFSFYDFSLERYGIGTLESWNFGFGKVAHMLLAGSIFSLLFEVPYAGILLAPFLVTILSTAAYLKLHGKIPNNVPKT